MDASDDRRFANIVTRPMGYGYGKYYLLPILLSLHFKNTYTIKYEVLCQSDYRYCRDSRYTWETWCHVFSNDNQGVYFKLLK